MLTDEEKIAWVDETIDWIDDVGGLKEIESWWENSHDLGNDVVFDMLKMYSKHKGYTNIYTENN